jgi:hypothetical protein
MKLSALALAAIAAFAASQAHASGDFNVSCGPMRFFAGDAGHAEYVTSTDVARNGIYWTVIHHMSSGKSYSRRVQYGASDISGSNFDCGSYSAPVSAPVEAAAPTRPAPGSLSTYLGM